MTALSRLVKADAEFRARRKARSRRLYASRTANGLCASCGIVSVARSQLRSWYSMPSKKAILALAARIFQERSARHDVDDACAEVRFVL